MKVYMYKFVCIFFSTDLPYFSCFLFLCSALLAKENAKRNGALEKGAETVFAALFCTRSGRKKWRMHLTYNLPACLYKTGRDIYVEVLPRDTRVNCAINATEIVHLSHYYCEKYFALFG